MHEHHVTGAGDIGPSKSRVSLFVFIGCFELAFGLSAILLAAYMALFDQVVIFAGSAGLIALAYCVVRPRLITVYDLLGAALLFAYGTGALNSLISYSRDNQDLITASTVGQYWFTCTLGLTLAVCGTLHLAGRVDHGSRLFLNSGSQTHTAFPSRMLSFVIVSLLMVCWELATGRIGFMGSVRADTGGQSIAVIPSIVLMIITPVGAMAISEALKPKCRYKWTLFVSGILLLLSQFGLGRRVFLFSTLTCVMCAVATKPPKKWLAIKPLILAAGLIALLQTATVAFYTMRIAYWSFRSSPIARVQILSIIPQAYKDYTSDTRGEIKAQIAENLKSRTFVLEYLAQIAQGQEQHGPLYGEDLHRAIIYAIPSVLYREKYRDPLFEEEEGLINPKLGLPVWDAANSILTAGVADFGWVGIFLYPLTLCMVLSAVLQLTRRRLPSETCLLLSLSACQLLLSVESDISSYISFIRTLIVVGVISWIVFRNSVKPLALAELPGRFSA